MRALLLALVLSACALPAPERPSGPAPQSRGVGLVTDPSRPPFSESDLARAVHAETNRVRRDRGLSALVWHRGLARVAEAYSRDMARRRFFAHVDPDGRDPTARATAGGVTCRRATGLDSWREGVGENLARDGLYRRYTETRSASGTRRTYHWYTLDALARAVVRAWMESPGHRRNLLDGGYRAEALGVAFTPSGDVYVTQSFC
jgi:uncharacterized protein YkwD